jgi:hypothetical protein
VLLAGQRPYAAAQVTGGVSQSTNAVVLYHLVLVAPSNINESRYPALYSLQGCCKDQTHPHRPSAAVVVLQPLRLGVLVRIPYTALLSSPSPLDTALDGSSPSLFEPLQFEVGINEDCRSVCWCLVAEGIVLL